jgi:psiF repeat
MRKLLSALAVTALLVTPAAFAASNSSTSSSTHAKHTSLKACNKEADAKKLTGAERSTFVKACHSAGKKSS